MVLNSADFMNCSIFVSNDTGDILMESFLN